MGLREYERSPDRTDARHGFYNRDFVTRLGTLRVWMARTRQRAFLPVGLARLERRAAEVLWLIREAFLRGLRVALITEEPVNAQTGSRLTRNVDQAVASFIRPRYPMTGGTCCWMGGPAGPAPQRTQTGSALSGLRRSGGGPRPGVRTLVAGRLPTARHAAVRDLPELLAFFQCPRALWRKLWTTNVIERCFVEVRRRTRSTVCVVNVRRVERSIFSLFNRFNLEWRPRTLRQFTQVARHHPPPQMRGYLAWGDLHR